MYEEELNLEDKKKFSLWLQQETFDMVEKTYHKDNPELFTDIRNCV